MRPVTVVSLRPFLRAAAQAGLDLEAVEAIEQRVAYDPEAGDLIEGSGGLRKRRVALAGSGRGKRGGARLITLFLDERSPVFIVTMYGKTTKTDLGASEKAQLAVLVSSIKAALRGGRG